MKEELIKFRELIKEYNGLFNVFSDKRTLFNLKVDDLCSEYDYRIHLVGLSEDQLSKFDSYSKAKYYFGTNKNVIDVLNAVRKNNQDVDRKKLISLLIRALHKNFGYDYQTAYFYVNNYMIYIESGFYKTKRCETLCENSLRRISNQTSVLKQNGIRCVDTMLGDLKLKLSPYTEEAKSSFDKVKTAAQPLVHQGSKTLVKVFTKLADMTKSDNNQN